MKQSSTKMYAALFLGPSAWPEAAYTLCCVIASWTNVPVGLHRGQMYNTDVLYFVQSSSICVLSSQLVPCSTLASTSLAQSLAAMYPMRALSWEVQATYRAGICVSGLYTTLVRNKPYKMQVEDEQLDCNMWNVCESDTQAQTSAALISPPDVVDLHQCLGHCQWQVSVF